MAYTLVKNFSLKTFNKGKGFDVSPSPKLDPSFSITYVTLTDGRDPADVKQVNEVGNGSSVVYILTKGEIKFTFYGKDPQKVVLSPNDYLYVTPGTKYDISGTGTLVLVMMPAYSDKTFLHPVK